MEKMMKNYNISFLVVSLIFLSACSEQKKEQTKTTQKVQEVKAPKVKELIVKKTYTMQEIYDTKCITCHQSDGAGNTEMLTPSMIGKSEKEIRDALKDIENDKGHIIMKHNREKIFEEGLEYSAKDMAKYMHKRFNR